MFRDLTRLSARRRSRRSRWSSATPPPAAPTCPGMSDYMVMVAGAGQGVPRRSAAGEDGDRRGVRRRVARRRRDARPRLRPGRLPRRRRARRASGSAGGSCARLNWRKRGPGPTAAAGRAAATTRRSCSASPRRPQGAVRPARGDRPGRRRHATSTSSSRSTAPSLVTGWARAARLPDRHPGQRPGRAVQRGGAEGDAVHPAGQPGRHPAAVPAQHHRLHGRHGVRAGRHHQARRA